MKLLRKLSTKDIVGDVRPFKEGETRRELYALAGVFKGYVLKETPFGQCIKFHGDFMAQITNPELIDETNPDGKYTSSVCYIVEPYAGMLRSAIDDISNQDTNTKVRIDFGINVSIIRSKREPNNLNKYEYDCIPLIQPKASETAIKILEQLGKEKKLLKGKE